MGRRADLPSGAGKDGYVHRNQQWLFGEIPVLDENEFKVATPPRECPKIPTRSGRAPGRARTACTSTSTF